MADAPSIETIRTGRLILRAPRPSDAGPIGHYCADPRVARMTASIPHPYPPGAAEAYLESIASGRLPEEVRVMDASPADWSETVGLIGFRPDRAEIGFWVGPPFWGTGFASEAVVALLEHLFRVRGLPRVRAEVQADNGASLRVLDKVGFRRAGEKPLHSVARGGCVPGYVLVRERGEAGA